MTRHSDRRIVTSVCVALAIVMIGVAATAAAPMLLSDQAAALLATSGKVSPALEHDRAAHDSVARRGKRDLPVG